MFVGRNNRVYDIALLHRGGNLDEQCAVLDILIVDDEPMIREFLSDLLTLRGHRLRTADSSSSALEELQMQPCDLVITDVFMPSTNGLDMAARIRGDYPHTRIVVMSGHSSGPDRKDPRWSAIDAFIGKPFTNQELTRVIENAFAQSASAGASQ